MRPGERRWKHGDGSSEPSLIARTAVTTADAHTYTHTYTRVDSSKVSESRRICPPFFHPWPLYCPDDADADGGSDGDDAPKRNLRDCSPPSFLPILLLPLLLFLRYRPVSAAEEKDARLLLFVRFVRASRLAEKVKQTMGESSSWLRFFYCAPEVNFKCCSSEREPRLGEAGRETAAAAAAVLLMLDVVIGLGAEGAVTVQMHL